jgi:kynurenine formamidase
VNPTGRIPSYRDLPRIGGDPGAPRTAWGYFGPSDEVGTVNWLQPDVVRQAATLVQWGSVYPLNWSLTLPDPPLLGRGAMRHVTKDLDPGTDDYYDNFYPQASSQWDALRHVGHGSYGNYNGLPLDDPGALGASMLGIEHWATRGIAGRFVLLDVDRFRAGLGDPIQPDEAVAIDADELDRVLASEGVSLRRGDILLLRFGWIRWYEQLDRVEREVLAAREMFSAVGLSPSERTAEWLWDNHVSAVASDSPALEVMPFDRSSLDGFLHYRLVTFLGLAVGELFALDALAADCAATRVYEGLFVAAPLNMPGGAGSTANAVALK